MLNKNKLNNIILIEDNHDDYQAFLRAFSTTSAAENCSIIWLDGVGYDEDHCLTKLKTIVQNVIQIPKLILLDINMPGINGKEIIDILRKTKTLQAIPIVIFSSSDDPEDIAECYTKGVSGFIKKPMELEHLKHICKILSSYWFEVVLLPPVITKI